jgi:hypothetical protein
VVGSPEFQTRGMARFGSHIFATALVVVALASCADRTTPHPAPSSRSPLPTSVQASPTESTTALATPAPTPTVTAPTLTPTVASPETPNQTPPQRVTGLTAQMGGGSGEVLLRWAQNPEEDVVSYVVLKALSPDGQQVRIGTVSREAVTEFEYVPFVDSDATVAYYRLVAVDSEGQEGRASAQVCGASYGHSC